MSHTLLSGVETPWCSEHHVDNLTAYFTANSGPTFQSCSYLNFVLQLYCLSCSLSPDSFLSCVFPLHKFFCSLESFFLFPMLCCSYLLNKAHLKSFIWGSTYQSTVSGLKQAFLCPHGTEHLIIEHTSLNLCFYSVHTPTWDSPLWSSVGLFSFGFVFTSWNLVL